MLGWPQKVLSDKIGLTYFNIISHYETGATKDWRPYAPAIRAALEADGIIFIPDGVVKPAHD